MVLCIVVLLVIFNCQVRLATQSTRQRQEAGTAAEGRDSRRLKSRRVRGEGHWRSVAMRKMLSLQLLLLLEVVVERKTLSSPSPPAPNHSQDQGLFQ